VVEDQVVCRASTLGGDIEAGLGRRPILRLEFFPVERGDQAQGVARRRHHV